MPLSEKDIKLAQKLGQPQPFVAVFPVFPQECMGQHYWHLLGQPNTFSASGMDARLPTAVHGVLHDVDHDVLPPLSGPAQGVY